eukprot:3144563-Amphidinium_carterae.2
MEELATCVGTTLEGSGWHTNPQGFGVRSRTRPHIMSNLKAGLGRAMRPLVFKMSMTSKSKTPPWWEVS